MTEHELVRELAEKASTKIVMLVADGIGGLPLEPSGRTELETAPTTKLGLVLSAAPKASMNLSTVEPVPTPTMLPACT